MTAGLRRLISGESVTYSFIRRNSERCVLCCDCSNLLLTEALNFPKLVLRLASTAVSFLNSSNEVIISRLKLML